MTTHSTETLLTESSVELIRTFDAPRDLVFEAWTNPEMAKQWSGCEGSTIHSVTVDLRVGGQCRTEMSIPGAGTMTAVGTYTEVDPPSKIAYRLDWEPAMAEAPETRVTVAFEDLGQQTRVRLLQEGVVNDEMKTAVTAGWTSSLDRFGETLPAREVVAAS